jgi:hypothetical protein
MENSVRTSTVGSATTVGSVTPDNDVEIARLRSELAELKARREQVRRSGGRELDRLGVPKNKLCDD